MKRIRVQVNLCIIVYLYMSELSQFNYHKSGNFFAKIFSRYLFLWLGATNFG